MRLLQCVISLDLGNFFVAFKKDNLQSSILQIFLNIDIWWLYYHLENFYEDIKINDNFTHIKRIVNLAKIMVVFKKDVAYDNILNLLSLELILFMATAIVEWVFSVKNFMKINLQKQMGNNWMNECLVVYSDRKVFTTIGNEDIIEHFQVLTKQKVML